ncbi:ABC transporter substrate-binding protein [Microlunatus antarcticus]|uniref:Sorbitol/mannitol transport system substrate-binding protein n=1 Tax=Microlunatus antarcticus TaxID=53388 RepID=A0A7W5P7W5_9ACTN|nr:sugar ABC transporter substrate-binding protein [Microlunatus antarcticus]MBB3327847.1 sorbitol/mannitol transport system substrate-binding protein [Microlunatus antarcticus]
MRFSLPRRRATRLTAGLAAASLAVVPLAACTTDGSGAGTAPGGTVTINVALAANPQMKTAESLISDFEAKNPGIKVKFTTLPENDLRPAVTKDVATNAGQFDVAMVGAYEVPIWAQKGWLVPLDDYVAKDTAWDAADLTTPIKDVVSGQDGKLYGAPFYGSSSFLFYRKDLAKKAGVTISQTPTWDEVQAAAAKMDDKADGVSGLCLRGLPGWGQNLAAITTVINTYGGRWFDESWNPQLTSPETEQAVQFYVDSLRKYGQPDAAKDGWEGCLQQMSQGKTAMWYDDTVFAGSVIDQATPEVKDNLGFAMAPTGPSGKASGWLWSWGLGITKSSKNADASWKFISWVTSKDYIKLAGEKAGWDSIPPGSRKSTYEIPEYKQAAASYADLTLKSINAATPKAPTVKPVPYTGVQYVQIPEFVDIGDYTSQQIAGAIAGTQSVSEALQKSQDYTTKAVKTAGLLK